MKMNTRNLDLSLYKSLIEADFTLLNVLKSQTNPYVQQDIQLTVKQTSTVNILETVKSVKQLIRMIQFLQKQKSPCLHIIVENRQHYFLLKEFFAAYPTKISMDLQNSFFLKAKSSSNATQMLFSFEKHSSTGNNRILKRLLLKNIFLINKVNAKLENNNKGTYKIYNDLLDFKKIIFLAVVLNEASLLKA